MSKLKDEQFKLVLKRYKDIQSDPMVPGLYDIVYSLAISTNFRFLPFFKFNFHNTIRP